MPIQSCVQRVSARRGKRYTEIGLFSQAHHRGLILSVPRIDEIWSIRLPLCSRMGNSRRDRANVTCPYESFRTSNSFRDRDWQTGRIGHMKVGARLDQISYIRGTARVPPYMGC